jgi:hypothetical protein
VRDHDGRRSFSVQRRGHRDDVQAFPKLGHGLLENAAPGAADDFAGAYGAEPATLWAEVLRQRSLSLRSIGLSGGHRIRL